MFSEGFFMFRAPNIQFTSPPSNNCSVFVVQNLSILWQRKAYRLHKYIVTSLCFHSYESNIIRTVPFVRVIATVYDNFCHFYPLYFRIVTTASSGRTVRILQGVPLTQHHFSYRDVPRVTMSSSENKPGVDQCPSTGVQFYGFIHPFLSSVVIFLYHPFSRKKSCPGKLSQRSILSTDHATATYTGHSTLTFR